MKYFENKISSKPLCNEVFDYGGCVLNKIALCTCALAVLLNFNVKSFADGVPVPTMKQEQSVQRVEIQQNPYYQLVETSTAGENTITKYEWNEAEKRLEPTYYEVVLTKLDIGEGKDTAYVNWSPYGELVPSDTSSGDDYITIHYDKEQPISDSIYNPSQDTIDSVTGTFVGDSFPVDNSGVINKIDGVFAGNYVGIENNGKIGSIAGYYIANENSAIYNRGEITSIDGYFAGNSSYQGGAINNSPDSGIESRDIAGPVFEEMTIGSIKGTFIGNYAQDSGGAIYNNEGIVGAIDADFIGNSADEGGAIANREADIASIKGTFIGNNAIYQGGAISSLAGYIGEISGDFYKNVVRSDYAKGGAIANMIYTAGRGSAPALLKEIGYRKPYGIKGINGNFVENAAIAEDNYSFAAGGAIYNIASIGEINGNFYKNTAVARYVAAPARESDSPVSPASSGDWTRYTDIKAVGGAIANENGNIGKISGNFVENSAVTKNSNYSSALGGAIFNVADIYMDSLLIDNGSTITTVDKDFTPLNIQNSNFINNIASASAKVAAPNNTHYYSPVYAYGGAVASIVGYENELQFATIEDLKDDLIYEGHDVSGLSDKEIIDLWVKTGNEFDDSHERYTTDKEVINPQISNSYFEGNKAIANGDEHSMALGGAVYSVINGRISSGGGGVPSSQNEDSIYKEKDNFAAMEITNTSFVNNTASAPNGTAKGGAIYSEGNLTINADNGVSLFKGNKTIDKNGEESNAIYMASLIDFSSDEARMSLPDNYNYMIKTAQLNLNAKNNGVIQIDDKIAGGAVNEDYNGGEQEESVNLADRDSITEDEWWDKPFIETPETAFDLNINGDKTGKVILNNDVINANIKLDNTNLYLGRENVFDQSQSLTLNSGSMFLINNSIGEMHIPTLNINGNTNLAVDVDLANKSMDRVTADNYNIASDSNLNVNYLNLLSDAAEDKTLILFADEQLKNNVAYTGESPIAYSPIWKYDVSYLKDSGEFMFVRGAAGSSESYNPAVLPAPVVTQAGAYSTQMQTFNYAFQHADNFMMFPSLERVAFASQNKYALAPDNGVFSPLMTPSTSNSFWVKPYASFESVPLQNGPKVSNINYGTLIGHDSEMKDIGNGFARVLTGYIGYNGSSQRFQGVDSYQNGGVLGGTATFYKGNFFNATTLSIGASAGDASTMYGNENFAMLMAGVGNKTGYNFEFNGGRFIFQPAMLMSYSFINTFDYTNAAGIRIDSDPLHAIQLSPGLKFIMNTESGWQPYLAVDMVWNILDDTRVRANDVRLPSMSIKPYVSYGLGVQRRFKNDKYTAFGQTMIHNGGRRGVSLTLGLRWKVGK